MSGWSLAAPGAGSQKHPKYRSVGLPERRNANLQIYRFCGSRKTGRWNRIIGVLDRRRASEAALVLPRFSHLQRGVR